MIGRRGLFLALLFWGCLWGSSAQAQNELGLSLRTPVEKGTDPAIVIKPTVSLKKLVIQVTRKQDKRVFHFSEGVIRRGEKRVFAFRQGSGERSYVARFDVTPKKGKKFAFEYAFEARVVPPLEISVIKKDVNLDGRALGFRSTRRTQQAEVVIYGDGGVQVGRGQATYGGAHSGRLLNISWEQKPANIKRIALKVWDPGGFWASMEVRPFFVEPWEDRIYFETGSHEIRSTEHAKLDATHKRIGDALKTAAEEYGDTIDMRLYVAGYTDTVGSASSNRQLSDRRAKSIAHYFMKKGLDIPIYYQGFGEDALAVKTPDSTDEERNRRTLYVLSSQVPVSAHFPRATWRKLQ